MVTKLRAMPSVIDVEAQAHEILNRWPAVGLAIGIVGRNGMTAFHGEGFADLASRAPVTDRTVFRIGSLTKTFTAVAVAQLWEQGAIDLDRPANDYLRGFKLVSDHRRFRPATVRQLLTHTAGISEVMHVADALRMRDMGDTVKAGRPLPSPAQRYPSGLRIAGDPGTRFMYTNHGFAALGQIIEDVTGQTVEDYFQERVFGPLGMSETTLLRSRLDRARLARPYELRSGGPQAVTEYEALTPAAGGVNSTPTDMARYISALLRNDGTLLKQASMRMLFEPHYQPDPRIPGMGLGFFRVDLHGRLAVEHDGILPGFDAATILLPDDGVGVMAFANGARRAIHWLAAEVTGVARRLVGVPEDEIRDNVPHHPEIWPELCGWYRFPAAWTDPGKIAIGPGIEVFVRRGRLMVRALSPVPALSRGFLMHPDDPADPYVFRIALPWFGIGTTRIVFSRTSNKGVISAHTETGPLSFVKQAASTNPKWLLAGALGLLGVAGAARLVRR